MKIGLIGCGGMGTTHNLSLKELSKRKDVQVVALADCRPEKLAQAAELWPEAHLYEFGEALLQQETLDAVDICLPSYLHVEHALMALEKGIHVFVEKPVCLTAADCQRLLDAQQASGCKVMVGQVLRSAAEYRFLKDAFDEGRYGSLHSIVMQRISGDVIWGFEDWFHNESKSGSVVLDLHLHDLDFLRWMLGEPDSFSCQAAALNSGMVNQIFVSYRFGRVLAVTEGCWDRSPALPFEASYRAAFDEATVVWNSRAAQPLTVYYTNGRVEYPELHTEYEGESSAANINISKLGPYYAELDYFVDCVMKDLPIQRAQLSEAVASVCQAIQELADAKASLVVQ